MNMYEVCAKCGHVGRNNYIDKVFAVKAESAKEAAAIVRQKPRVKHDHKDAIRYVERIDVSRYREIINQNKADPYLHCRNIQEQRRRCKIEPRRDEVFEFGKDRISKEKKTRKKYYKKKELRDPKKYINNYVSYEEYAS